MDAGRWQQIELLYNAAFEQPAESRAEYLDRACANDPDLRNYVESLLLRDKAGLFDRPAWEALIENEQPRPRHDALQPGAQLGGYRITGPLGAGGMGEVYLARDTKLDRDVAIKVLPTALAQDPERLARFEREAKVLASLNHPNIAQIYGVEDSSGVRALAMELVPGAAISGPLPVETVIAWAGQLASALETAHERGIIHRDLKPANILVTPDGVIKVLDFGLARPAASQADNAATTTGAGIILGTAGYMAPEQARGKVLDKRADIWAFGVLLYEMSTGKRLFAGETAADTLATVVTKDPDLSAVPVRLRRLVRSCLQKDPKNRLRDIGDWSAHLDDASFPAAGAGPRKRSALLWAIAAGVLAAGVVAVGFRGKPVPAASYAVKLHLANNFSVEPSGDVVLSPDGRHAVFPGFGPDGYTLFIQDFDGSEARPVPGAKLNQSSPPSFWSPDSRYAVFSARGTTIQKIDVTSGLITDICEKPGPMVGGSWNPDGVIIFGSTTTGLWRAPAGPGNAIPLTRLDKTRREIAHQLPMFLPDGKHFIYLTVSADSAQSGIYAASLDDGPNTPPRQIVSAQFNARFVPGENARHSWLLYLRDGDLVAQAFDANGLALTGRPQPLPLHVGMAYNTALFSAAPDVLASRSDTGNAGRQFTWVDLKTGQPAGTVGAVEPIGHYASLSPDETRVAWTKETADFHHDIRVLDVSRGTSILLTSGDSDDPVWSPDGRQIAFARNVDGVWQIQRKPADGSGTEQLLLREPESIRPLSWSRDGKFLLYEVSAHGTFERSEIGVLPLDGVLPSDGNKRATRPFRFSVTPGVTRGLTDAAFSPDGRYIAYQSDETGTQEVYVRSFSPGADAGNAPKWLISNAGGHAPAWSPDGRKLYWRSLSATHLLMEADVETAHGFHASAPMKLLDWGPAQGEYVIISRGRALLAFPLDPLAGQTIDVLFNWRSLLK
jgi:Tol biopolymer transport system component